MVELKQLEYFVACAQAGSFSKAAELLLTTQPSVSKVIKSMENQMQVTLFKRTAKGIRLTEEGELVYGHAEEILQNMKALEHISTSVLK